MKRKITGSVAATAALLAIAGMAQAAPAELNIYGASAQYLYWNDQAKNFAQNVLGCPLANITGPVNNGGKHGFVSATACTNTNVPVNSATGTRDIEIRYSGIASAEGPLAVSKQTPIDASLASGCSVANGERKMYASSSTLVCKQVHIGTSDVAGESLIQSSTGQKLGRITQTSINTAAGTFSASLPGYDMSAMTPFNTVVVPFGFFVNKAVTAKQCTTGLVGQLCTTNAHCNTNDTAAPAGVCGAAATISNITREEASLIFSGYATNWSDLGGYYTAQPILACLRHAGSGTHAALDLTVMNSGWGNNTVAAEVPGNIYFNQASGDEIKCINGASDATPNGSLVGAIGYADGDQAINVANTSQNVVQLKYNGQYPTRTAVRNGQYEFYTNAWLYTNPANSLPAAGPIANTANVLAADLATFASDPANVPSTKANFWAAVAEMRWNRSNDVAYPNFAGGASIPMVP